MRVRTWLWIVGAFYVIARGINIMVPLVWIVIHTVVIVTGLFVLRSAPGVSRSVP